MKKRHLKYLRELNVGQDHWIISRANPGYDRIHCYAFINKTSNQAFIMAFGDPHDPQFKEFKELEKMADLLKDGEKRK